MVKKKIKPETGSFRDRNGFVFLENGEILRQVNLIYRENYDQLIGSGLYRELTESGQLIAHRETTKMARGAYKIIQPEMVPFISYPYGWSFGQLKAAALLTLKIELESLKYGMSLKDASAYNVQFIGTIPIFIDTLSFEKYREGQPWVAYRQFCRHFLAPLALMAMRDVRLGQLSKIYIDGLPLDLADKLLPPKALFNLGILAHIKLNSRLQGVGLKRPEREMRLEKKSLENLIRHLYATTEKLELGKNRTEWGDYYQETNYSKKAFADKRKLVKTMLRQTKPKTVIDLGANSGVFSEIAADIGAYTIAADSDFLAVEKNFRNFSKMKKRILPILVDLTNPTPALGWRNVERKSFLSRAKADTVMALALIHHLAIGNNVPLGDIARFMAQIGRYLIIEFVPKEDSKVEFLLQNREDIFDDYSTEGFERSFKKFFEIRECQKVKESKRSIYLMERK